MQVAAYVSYVEENRISDPATSVLQSKTTVKEPPAPASTATGAAFEDSKAAVGERNGVQLPPTTPYGLLLTTLPATGREQRCDNHASCMCLDHVRCDVTFVGKETFGFV